MKVLLDTCVWGRAKAALAGFGHDVVWMGDAAVDPGDEQILAQAHQEERVLVTLDKDFGDLVILRGLPHHGIIRLVNIPARQQADICQSVLVTHGKELLAGAMATVDRGRVRMRPASSTW